MQIRCALRRSLLAGAAVVASARLREACAAHGRVVTLATSLCAGRRAPCRAETMDEWDVPQMKKEVESLKYQLAFKREKSSKTVTE